jgi:hypothetical protein
MVGGRRYREDAFQMCGPRDRIARLVASMRLKGMGSKWDCRVRCWLTDDAETKSGLVWESLRGISCFS